MGTYVSKSINKIELCISSHSAYFCAIGDDSVSHLGHADLGGSGAHCREKRETRLLSHKSIQYIQYKLLCDKTQQKAHQPVTVVVAVEGGVGWWGGAVVEGAVTIVAAEEDDEGPKAIP